MSDTLGNMFDFASLFEEEIASPPTSGLVMDFNVKRTYPDVENLIFVEGSDDEFFYKRTKDPKLNGKHDYIYAHYYDEKKGKEAVMDAFQEITGNSTFSKELPRTIFIVDNDWDHLISGKWDEGILVTDGHSFENYFLSECNLDLLFGALGHDTNVADRFKEEYYSFCRETAVFWALKGTIVFAYQNGILFRYTHKWETENIFDFKFADGKVVYDEMKFKEEIKLMENGISHESRLTHYKELLQKKIEENPKYIRGHQALKYLQCYLLGEYGFSFSRSDNLKFLTDIIFKYQVDLR